MDSATLQAMQGMENTSVSQDALGNTTIIYEQGEQLIHRHFLIFLVWYVTMRTNSDSVSMCSSAESSDLSAQNALDLLLNMSNARELVGNSLQVGAVAWQKFSLWIKSS